jgi:hypothetical protein
LKKQRKNSLTSEKITELNAVGLVVEFFDDKWDKKFNCLIEFRKSHPFRWPKRSVKNSLENELAEWVRRQRQNNKNGLLNPRRKARLDAIGFLWKD